MSSTHSYDRDGFLSEFFPQAGDRAEVEAGAQALISVGQVREIEVKYRVHDLAAVEEALRVHGVSLSDPVHQDDQAYAPQGWHYGMSKLGVAFARLRTQDGRHLFTLKRPMDNELACLEYETEVADRDQMHQAIQQMGFYPTVRIVKTRRTGRLGELSLCLDDVANAGVFLEIEKVVGPGVPGEVVQAGLHAFASSLGVPLERSTETYDSLVRAAAGV
jgi:adenylate cyclase class 2